MIKSWFIKNHTSQHTQIRANRIAVNLEIAAVRAIPLQPYSVLLLAFIGTTLNIQTHKIEFNTTISHRKRRIYHTGSFNTYTHKNHRVICTWSYFSCGDFYTSFINNPYRFFRNPILLNLQSHAKIHIQQPQPHPQVMNNQFLPKP